MDRYIEPLNNADDEEVGRKVKNAFGLDEIIVMPSRYWKYYDWLADKGLDMDEWVKQRDIERHNHSCGGRKFQFSLPTQVKAALSHSEQERYLNGLEVPLFIRPSGYEKVDTPPEGEVDVAREVLDCDGKTVSVVMPSRYWKYFDWLARQGNDMVKWVQDIDFNRKQGERVYELYCLLMNSLREDEKRRYKL